MEWKVKEEKYPHVIHSTSKQDKEDWRPHPWNVISWRNVKSMTFGSENSSRQEHVSSDRYSSALVTTLT